MHLHLDITVSSAAELNRQRAIAETLGAELVLDRTDAPDEPLYVFADLSGHPFCIFAGWATGAWAHRCRWRAAPRRADVPISLGC
jgi:Glyoxalase-like domain